MLILCREFERRRAGSPSSRIIDVPTASVEFGLLLRGNPGGPENEPVPILTAFAQRAGTLRDEFRADQCSASETDYFLPGFFVTGFAGGNFFAGAGAGFADALPVAFEAAGLVAGGAGLAAGLAAGFDSGAFAAAGFAGAAVGLAAGFS